MAKVICKHCGATGISKCPVCRSVFPSDMYESCLSHILKWKENGDKDTVTLTFTHYRVTNSKTHILDALKDLANVMKNLSEGVLETTLESYSCDHKWIFAPGEESSIGCGHSPS